MKKMIVRPGEEPEVVNLTAVDRQLQAQDAAADAAFDIVQYHKDKIEKFGRSKEMGLLIEAIEDTLGLPRGKLIADAQAKIPHV